MDMGYEHRCSAQSSAAAATTPSCLPMGPETADQP